MLAALLRWFDAHARPLPWRTPARDPYVTWVVESMSQQTRIETVIARLPGFLQRFADVRALAAAEVGEVLAAWAGLGYYRRARALHAAARVVVHELGGAWPTSVEGWRRLPGVGPYTAAAVAAQAFGVPVIAVDGNVRRVGARLSGLSAPRDAELEVALAAHLRAGGADDRELARASEALVELGALVCTPRNPRCDACPLRADCAGAAAGDPTRFPAPRRRARGRELELHAWLVTRQGADGRRQVALERRRAEGLWGGLHGPPWRERPPAEGERLGAFRHLLTHRRVEAVVWRCAAPPGDGETLWSPSEEAASHGLAAIDRRALAFLEPSAPDRTVG